MQIDFARRAQGRSIALVRCIASLASRRQRLAERITNLLRGTFKCIPRRKLCVIRPELESEPVASEPREDMQVHVEDFLHGGLTIGEEKVHAFAPEATRALCCGNALCNLHEVTRRRCV